MMKIEMSPTYRKNALIVDDDAAILYLISSWMKYREWNVETAYDGTEAFDLLAGKKDFDVVLTDYNMPQMDGLVLAEKIKEMDPLIRVVLITGTCRDIVEREINIIYIDDILYKPFSLDKLDSILTGCIAGNSIADSFMHRKRSCERVAD